MYSSHSFMFPSGDVIVRKRNRRKNQNNHPSRAVVAPAVLVTGWCVFRIHLAWRHRQGSPSCEKRVLPRRVNEDGAVRVELNCFPLICLCLARLGFDSLCLIY